MKFNLLDAWRRAYFNQKGQQMIAPIGPTPTPPLSPTEHEMITDADMDRIHAWMYRVSNLPYQEHDLVRLYLAGKRAREQSIPRTELKKGDTIVISYDKSISMDNANRIKVFAQEVLGKEHEIMVLGDGLKLSVLGEGENKLPTGYVECPFCHVRMNKNGSTDHGHDADCPFGKKGM